MGRTFNVELVSRDPDGRVSQLWTEDLRQRAVRKEYLRLLDRLTNDFYYSASRMGWPRGPDGSWISFPLGERVAVCQWDKGNPDLWDSGQGLGTLTVMRILTGAQHAEFVRQGSQPWTLAGPA
ncbi:hypothetical protein [Specibacter cremeus]|uniref:hypothetical protein n=1 Tax=Specibacter cremeus TaxID=1629051 RepID=UPI000F7A757E|nr:hypothetical protein [Specibacter cremeus]